MLELPLLYLGELVPARTQLEQGISLYAPNQQQAAYAFLNIGDMGVICRLYGSLALWILGYPERAKQERQEAIRLARPAASSCRSGACTGPCGVVCALPP
jgi:hypothetical protein